MLDPLKSIILFPVYWFFYLLFLGEDFCMRNTMRMSKFTIPNQPIPLMDRESQLLA